MRINTLNKLRIKDNHKIKEIEDYLDQEIAGILSKKKYTNYYDPSHNERAGTQIKDMFNARREQQSYYNDEPVLPFNQEEIRPRIRDNYQAQVKNQETSDQSVGRLILGALKPMIEDWIDENLEKVVHKIVKKQLMNREALSSSQHNEGSRSNRALPSQQQEYYDDNEDDYYHNPNQYTMLNKNDTRRRPIKRR